MPIPSLNEHGLLPVGIHDCTLAELREMFGQNQWVPGPATESRREVLCPNRDHFCNRLESYISEIHGVGLVIEILVDGSYVTTKPDPNDVDLVVVLPPDHDFSRDLSTQEYNLLSKRRLRRRNYPFDVLVVAAGSTAFQAAIGLYERVRDREDLRKGFLRVRP
jgi:hypothetical protein